MIFPGLTADSMWFWHLIKWLFVTHDVQVFCLADLLIVPTCQRSKMDLVQTGEAVETEKDDLLEKVESALTRYTSW